MKKDEKLQDIGDKVTNWQVPEYDKHERSKKWYINASIITLLLLIYSFFTANFLFAVIIIIVAIIIVLHDGQEPNLVDILMTDEGIVVGSKFYDYDEIKDFSIVYKPKQGVKNLYFEFKNVFKPRLSIPLFDVNPLKIRKNLLKYLSEDLERTDLSASEGLAKLFKL